MSKGYKFKNMDTLVNWDLLNKLSDSIDQGDASTPVDIINILIIALNDQQLEGVQKDLKRFL